MGRELVVVRRGETAERVPHEEKPHLAGDVVLSSLSHLAVVPEHALVDLLTLNVIIVESRKDLHPERARGLGDVAVLQGSVSIRDQSDILRSLRLGLAAVSSHCI